jgi:hypothetical protein
VVSRLIDTGSLCGDHGAVVAAVGGLVQPAAVAAAEGLHQLGHGPRGELADGADAHGLQPVAGASGRCR